MIATPWVLRKLQGRYFAVKAAKVIVSLKLIADRTFRCSRLVRKCQERARAAIPAPANPLKFGGLNSHAWLNERSVPGQLHRRDARQCRSAMSLGRATCFSRQRKHQIFYLHTKMISIGH
jgi:hypothetical protein